MVILLNSNLLFNFYREFFNKTVNIQINDIRKLPIIIPTEQKLLKFKTLFDQIVEIKKKSNNSELLLKLEFGIDQLVNKLYQIV